MSAPLYNFHWEWLIDTLNMMYLSLDGDIKKRKASPFHDSHERTILRGLESAKRNIYEAQQSVISACGAVDRRNKENRKNTQETNIGVPF